VNFVCETSRYDIGISGLGSSKFVFLPVPVSKEFKDLLDVLLVQKSVGN